MPAPVQTRWRPPRMMLQVPWLLWISFRWAVDVDFTAVCLLPLPLPAAAANAAAAAGEVEPTSASLTVKDVDVGRSLLLQKG